MFERLQLYLIDISTVLLNMPVNVTEKFYFLYVLSFIGLAYFSYRHYYGQQPAGFLGFVFPRKVYLHPSAKIDYAVFLINLLLSPLILVGVAIQTTVSISIGELLMGLNGGQAIFVGNWNAPVFALFIIGYTMAADLSVYIVHRLHHQWNVLWPIHALHHSAQVLTPVTLFRKHPVWNLTSNIVNKTLTGLFQGAFLFFFYGVPGVELLFGINTVYVLYNFCGANLRHSHIWLSWGRPLSHIFISPAMHQIHHDPNRMNRNYGEIFAIWDWMFGTLYIPKQREEFAIGLGQGIDNPHNTIAKAYYVPLLACARAAGNLLVRRGTNSNAQR